MKPGWRKLRVGDILTLEYGKPLAAQDRKMDGRYPVYGANGEVGRTDKFYYDKPSIIVGRKGSAGELNLSEERFWALDVTYFVVIDDTEFDLRFVYHLLKTLNLPSMAKGVKPGINRNDVYSRHVFVPPLAEQKRIVAVLDQAFDGIDGVRANTEAALFNAEAIFDSYLAQVFEQREAGWIQTTEPLKDLCELIVDCEHKTAPTGDTGIPLIRTPNIAKGELRLDGVYRVSEKTYKEWTRRAEPRAGDLILAREAPAGNVAVIPDNLKVCLGQRTVLIRTRRDVFEPAFLAFFLLQPQIQRKLLAHSRGATVQHVNMKDIRALKIGAIPPLPTQRQLLNRIQGVVAASGQLSAALSRKLTAISALRASLLDRAFAGEM